MASAIARNHGGTKRKTDRTRKSRHGGPAFPGFPSARAPMRKLERKTRNRHKGNSALSGRPVSGSGVSGTGSFRICESAPSHTGIAGADAILSFRAATLGDDHRTGPPPFRLPSFPVCPDPPSRTHPPRDAPGGSVRGTELPEAPASGPGPVSRSFPEPSGPVQESCWTTGSRNANRIFQYQQFIHKTRIYVSILYLISSRRQPFPFAISERRIQHTCN